MLRMAKGTLSMLVWACGPLVLAAASVGASAAPEREVKSIRPLLLDAIRKGAASGHLVNDGTAWTNKVFGTDAPIVVEVKRVADLQEAGCKRLKITTSQRQVVQWNDETGEKNAPNDMTFSYEIGYCEDGAMLGIYGVKP